jgi:hypothetical protein
MANLTAMAAKPAPAKSVAKPVGKSTKSTKKPQESYKPSGDVREVISYAKLRKMVISNANDETKLTEITTKYKARKNYVVVKTIVQSFGGKEFETMQEGVSLRKAEKAPLDNVLHAYNAGNGFKGYVDGVHIRLYWQKTGADKKPLAFPVAWISANGEKAVSWEEYLATK